MEPDEIVNKTIARLERVRSKPVSELETGLDQAQLMIVDLRDDFIERLRREGPKDRIRYSLDQVNLALSMIIGLEYPLGGFHREKIRQAEAVLRGILSKQEKAPA